MIVVFSLHFWQILFYLSQCKMVLIDKSSWLLANLTLFFLYKRHFYVPLKDLHLGSALSGIYMANLVFFWLAFTSHIFIHPFIVQPLCPFIFGASLMKSTKLHFTFWLCHLFFVSMWHQALGFCMCFFLTDLPKINWVLCCFKWLQESIYQVVSDSTK